MHSLLELTKILDGYSFSLEDAFKSTPIIFILFFLRCHDLALLVRLVPRERLKERELPSAFHELLEEHRDFVLPSILLVLLVLHFVLVKILQH